MPNIIPFLDLSKLFGVQEMPELKQDVPSGSLIGRVKLTKSMSVFNKTSKEDRPYQRLKPKCDENPTEVDGPKGPEPTRYGDWERKGRCIDF